MHLLEGNDAKGDEQDVVPSIILEMRSKLVLVPPREERCYGLDLVRALEPGGRGGEEVVA